VVSRLATILVLSLCSASTWSSPSTYALHPIAKADITEITYWQSPVEDKTQFDCERFKVRRSDVLYALRHSRQVARQRWLADERAVSIGCHASVVVALKNGDHVDVTLEPNGKVFARPRDGRAADRAFYYLCGPCGQVQWFDDPLNPRSASSAGR
jgi:hypothetical protein